MAPVSIQTPGEHSAGKDHVYRLAVVLAAFSVASLTATAATAQHEIALPATDRSIELRLEPLCTVGELGGQQWEEFQSLDAAAFGPTGRLYLLDGGRASVVAVDAEGHLVRRLGRRGGGPGELREASAVVALRDGRIGVWDAGKRAFVMFDSAGAVLDEIRLDYASGVPGERLTLTTDGRLVGFPARLLTGRLGHAYIRGDGFARADPTLPILRFGLAPASMVEVVAQARMPATEAATTSVRRAFEPLPSFGPIAGGGIALQHSADYRIDILRGDGSLVRAITRPIPPRAVTAADRRAFEESQGDVRVRTLGQGDAGARPADGPVSYHPVVPPVLGITTDGGRHIWVQRRHPSNPTRSGPIDILTADGLYVGTIPAGALPGLPAAFGPDDLVVFLTTGEYDVPLAQVYRLPPALR